MKYIVVFFLVILLTACTSNNISSKQNTISQPSNISTTTDSPTKSREESQINPDEQVVAQGLDTPWALALLPDNSILVTERKGSVRLIESDGNLISEPVANISQVQEIGEGGLLGVAIHPNFSVNHYIYLYYTYSSTGNNTRNRVVRMNYINQKLTDQKIILDNIPGASNHDGGRIKFGPDGFLYIGTGDAQEPSQSQNIKSLAGKILRITDEGNPAPNNPFNNEIYSYGHRNVQGLAWSADNQLWSTEHGPSGIGSCCDELNMIESGKNYGWPIIQGDKSQSGMLTPVKHSGNNNTWAPSGAAIIGDSVFFSGLRGEALYEAKIKDNKVIDIKEHYKKQYGRIREVIAGKNNSLYITTSNQDGRGAPKSGDDKVILINL